MTDFHAYVNRNQTRPNPGLSRISRMMDLLGNPERDLRCIHVGGTNGKGSVCAYLDSILRRAGHRVGRFTSPNLVRVHERITVDGDPIPDGDLDRILSTLEGIAKEVETLTGELPTPFEIWCAAAFLYFKETACDLVVLEVGMGGEFDATNVIPGCEVSILTRIDLDHTEHLGKTVEEIARTKCGIIKEACATHTVISAPQTPAVARIIEEEAAKKGCKVLFTNPPAPRKKYGMHEAFFFPGYGDVRCGLAGIHQIENAYIALTCASLMGVDIFSAQCGVTFAHHAGRLETLPHEDILLYDGAHNPNGIRALTASLDRYWPDRPRTYIFACMRDKDVGESLRLLARPRDRFVFTTVQNNPRAMGAEELAAFARTLGIEGEVYPTLADAIEGAVIPYRVNVICGSLYLYADLPEKYRSV